MNKERLDSFLLKMISDFCGYDCSFIKEAEEYAKMKSFFLDFFKLKEIEIRKIKRNVYLIDKYIVKIKSIYQPEYLIDCECIVKVYYKKNYLFKIHNNNLEFGIEIQDYIDSLEEVTYEDLYNLYSNLREKGYIWLDVKPNNVVKENNKLYIIDTDYIFKKEDSCLNSVNIEPSEFAVRFNEIYEDIQKYHFI